MRHFVGLKNQPDFLQKMMAWLVSLVDIKTCIILNQKIIRLHIWKRNFQTFLQPIQYLLVHVFAKSIVNHQDEHDLLTSNLVVCKLMPNSQQDVSSCETFLEKPVFWKVAFCRCNTITCGMYTWNFNWYLILDDNEIQY